MRLLQVVLLCLLCVAQLNARTDSLDNAYSDAAASLGDRTRLRRGIPIDPEDRLRVMTFNIQNYATFGKRPARDIEIEIVRGISIKGEDL